METAATVAILLIVWAVCFSLLSLIFLFLWNFVAPTFGIPLLNIYTAMAIVILLGFIGKAVKTA